jgi:hypothetical protein
MNWAGSQFGVVMTFFPKTKTCLVRQACTGGELASFNPFGKANRVLRNKAAPAQAIESVSASLRQNGQKWGHCVWKSEAVTLVPPIRHR